jgi:hypothetical protein
MTRSRIVHCLGLLFAVTLLSPLAALAQTPAPASTETSDTKLNDMIKETQKQVDGKNLAGIVWWVPVEFWEQSAMQDGASPQKARETFGSLRQYTMVIILAGKIGIGNVNWFSGSDLRSSTSLRDADGQVYKPVSDISSDAAGVTSIIKPVMANILGPAGQNLEILFFPATTASGKLIADPAREGRFVISIENLPGTKPLTFEWLLPLTSLTPPKFCPVGKERVEANWKYCPWHGVKLPDNMAPIIPLLELKLKDSKPQ